MAVNDNITISRNFLERAFNQGDLSAVDELMAADGVDHQEPPGTDFRAHLKQVITMLRTAFPDLHFEIHTIMEDGETVAFRSTMTGTHLGVGTFSPVPIPPTGRKVAVAHMHFVRMENGQAKDLWHLWDLPGMLRQLGVAPVPQQRPEAVRS